MSQRAGDAFVPGALGELMLGVDEEGNYAPMPVAAATVSGFAHDSAVLPTAGDAHPISVAPVPLRRGVTIRANSGNDDDVYVGLVGVTVATGFPLSAGQSVFIPVSDVSLVRVIADHAGDGVSYIAY